MTTPEAPPAALWYKIVVCGTCDNVFREHAGRPTCPTCGGPPIIELFSAEIPLEAPAEAPSGEGEDFDEVDTKAPEAKDAAIAAESAPALRQES